MHAPEGSTPGANGGAATAGQGATAGAPAAAASPGRAAPAFDYICPVPDNEEARLEAIARLGLAQEEDPVLNSLCKLMCSLLKVPSAGVSIVERNKQWYAARGGSTPNVVLPRAQSICQHTFLPMLPSFFVVEDAEKDERFKSHPLVAGDKGVRFFAGAPLIMSNGFRVGTLCLLDNKPRQLSMEEYQILANCAEIVVRRLERDHFSSLHGKRTQGLLRTLKKVNEGIMLCDVGVRGWKILYVNSNWSKQTGVKEHECEEHTVWDLFEAAPQSQEQAAAGFTELISTASAFELHMQRRNLAGAPVLRLAFKPATSGVLGPEIQLPETVPRLNQPLRELPFYFVLVEGAHGDAGGEGEALLKEGAAAAAAPSASPAPRDNTNGISLRGGPSPSPPARASLPPGEAVDAPGGGLSPPGGGGVAAPPSKGLAKGSSCGIIASAGDPPRECIAAAAAAVLGHHSGADNGPPAPFGGPSGPATGPSRGSSLPAERRAPAQEDTLHMGQEHPLAPASSETPHALSEAAAASPTPAELRRPQRVSDEVRRMVRKSVSWMRRKRSGDISEHA